MPGPTKSQPRISTRSGRALSRYMASRANPASRLLKASDRDSERAVPTHNPEQRNNNSQNTRAAAQSHSRPGLFEIGLSSQAVAPNNGLQLGKRAGAINARVGESRDGPTITKRDKRSTGFSRLPRTLSGSRSLESSRFAITGSIALSAHDFCSATAANGLNAQPLQAWKP
eukprot:CAMPEP_0174909308 /NCGR_PEP_ID=MMETSP0167-20121228/68066_1 /TAXON_ID=38298 /ORGANISM="Rhodella maculata, Strain CCMP736" /LENGTH=170 /DNA_ID=CAMNT_0016153277 /DNA_START=225 /DNA_END=734 /DNA_ORIENTATION=+